jgi:hypothetical protein
VSDNPNRVNPITHDDAIANLEAIREVVDRQAEDEGLWSLPLTPGTQPIMEAYLQQELRHLHKIIEDYTSWVGDDRAEGVRPCDAAERKTSEGERGSAAGVTPAQDPSARPFDPWCPYCGADSFVSGCVEGECRG